LLEADVLRLDCLTKDFFKSTYLRIYPSLNLTCFIQTVVTVMLATRLSLSSLKLLPAFLGLALSLGSRQLNWLFWNLLV
jgi:hypothetical protein